MEGLPESKVNFLKIFQQTRGANTAPSKTCTYIEGHKPYGDHPYCEAPSKQGSSYCGKHHAICYRAIDVRENTGFMRHAEFIARIAK